MNDTPPHVAYLDDLRALAEECRAECRRLLNDGDPASTTPGLDRLRNAARAAGAAVLADTIDRAVDRLENGVPDRPPQYRAGHTTPLGWVVFGPDGEESRGFSRESGDGFVLESGYNPPSLTGDGSAVQLTGYPAVDVIVAGTLGYLRGAVPGSTLVEFHLLESPVDPVMWCAVRITASGKLERACGFAPSTDVARIVAAYCVKKNSFENPVT